jgi:hypothetical protein
MKEYLLLSRHKGTESFKEFVTDQSIAGLFNVGGTIFFDHMLSVSNKTLLSISWPIIEKIGFFAKSSYDMYNLYQETPQEERESLIHYGKQIIQSGGKSMLKDIAIHDPIYGLFMYFGLKYNEQTPSWMISFVSFVTAVFCVFFIEYGYSEAKYVYFKYIISHLWFNLESYEESKMLIDSKTTSEDIYTLLKDDLWLWEASERLYHDQYFPIKDKNHADKELAIRLRSRQEFTTWESSLLYDSTQILFTKATKYKSKKLEQYNYFPIEKYKFHRPWHDISDLHKYINPQEKTITKKFHRILWSNPEWLLVTIDTDTSKTIELKAYQKDKRILIETIKKLMDNFWWVQQITLWKHQR